MALHRAEQPNDSLRVAYEGTLGPATWACVHWIVFESDGTPTFAQFNSLVDDLKTLFGNHFVHSAYHPSQMHFTSVKARYRLQAGPEVYRTVRIADVSGTADAATEAAQVCYLVNWATADHRRGGKARSYIAGVPSAQMADSARLASAAVAAVTEAANDYLDAIPALSSGPLLNGRLVDMSFRNDHTWRDEPHAFPILAGSVSAEVATQRDRVGRLRT